MPDTPNPAASALDQIRERARYAVTYDDWHQVGRDARRLLKAVDAVLELTRDGSGDDLYPSIDITVGEVREAITRELTGTQQGEDGNHD